MVTLFATKEARVSLTGRLGRAVLKRIEASPAVQGKVERSERMGPVIRAAWAAAYSPLDDGETKLKLQKQLESLGVAPQLVAEALADFGMHDGYIDDRACRLIAAVAEDAAVEPIAQGLAELFAEEEALGRLPMNLAFRRLADMEPALRDLEQQARSVSAGEDRLPQAITQPLRQLVGAGACTDHELLCTNLATSIAHQYLEMLAGNTRLGTADTPYFDSPRKQVIRSAMLVDRRHPKRSNR